MRLFKVEIRRIFSRRLTMVLGILVLVAIALGAILTFAHAGQRSFEGGAFTFDQNGQPVRILGGSRARGFNLVALRDIWANTTAAFGFVALILGASLIGAEWRSRTVELQLTWEPRRARLALTKIAAAASFTLVAYLVVEALIGVSLWPTAAIRGSTAGLTSVWWSDAIGVLLRGAATSVVVVTIGFAIALVGRNAAAAIGVLFVYSTILEGVLGGNFRWMRRWLLIPNMARFVNGRGNFGEVAQASTTGAGLTLAFYALVVTAAAISIFRTRDVT